MFWKSFEAFATGHVGKSKPQANAGSCRRDKRRVQTRSDLVRGGIIAR